jgi:hypothetical protein
MRLTPVLFSSVYRNMRTAQSRENNTNVSQKPASEEVGENRKKLFCLSKSAFLGSVESKV